MENGGLENSIEEDIEKKISWKKRINLRNEKNQNKDDKIKEVSSTVQSIRLEQQNHVSDLKDFFCAEIGKMKNEIKTEIENFKSELNTEMRTKFDLLEQFNIQTREEIKGIKKTIIDTGTDPTRSQKVFDKLSNINRATESSQERLRGIKEDMINLNVKVDNVTEKLIMDRLGFIEKGSSNGNNPTPKNMNKIEEDLDKIKFYTQRNYRILGINASNAAVQNGNSERKARFQNRKHRSRSRERSRSSEHYSTRRSARSSSRSSNRSSYRNGGKYTDRNSSYRNGKQSK